MKKILLAAISILMVCCLIGCSSGGVSKEEYNKVVEERDMLKSQLEQANMTPVTEQQDNSPAGETSEADAFHADAVKAALEVKTYQWNDDSQFYLALEVKNTSQYTLDINGTVTFYDSNKAMIGSQDNVQTAVPSESSILLVYYNESEFSSYEYDLTPSKSEYYVPMTQNLQIESNNTDKKVVISVTNNGDIPALFVQMKALFFQGDTPVSFNRTYCMDSDSELKPRAAKTCEIRSTKDFDTVKLYVDGWGDKQN